jgi:hypothetical protein
MKEPKMNNQSTPKNDPNPFPAEIQEEIAACLLTNEEKLKEAVGLVEPEYFDNSYLQEIVRILLAYFEQYGHCPSRDHLQTELDRLKDQELAEPRSNMLTLLYEIAEVLPLDYSSDRLGGFCREKAVKQAIIDSCDLLTKKHDVPEILRRMKKAGEVGLQTTYPVRPAFTGTLTDFFNADLPEAEVLIEGLLAREEFMLMGGVKHSHKTTVMMDLGLHYASGRGTWLNFPIPRPGRFLMVQQELGEAEFRKRLKKAVDAGQFESDNFFPCTTTNDPIKIIEEAGFDRLRKLCEKRQPDILALDPLHTLIIGGENDDKAFAKVRDRINYLKITYKCAVILSHHFSSKRPKDDPNAPAEAGGLFRGHSVLSDAADVLFLLHRLPGQKGNPNFRLAYEDYNVVEITLRNGKWPRPFAVEFNGETFLMNVSDVWHEVGAKIEFGEVREAWSRRFHPTGRAHPVLQDPRSTDVTNDSEESCG